METGNIFVMFAAGYAFYALTFSGYQTKETLLAFSGPGVAVLTMLFLLFYDINGGRFGSVVLQSQKTKRSVLGFFYFPVFVLSAIICAIDIIAVKFKAAALFPAANYVFELLWSPLRHFQFFLGFDFLIPNGGIKIKGLHILFITCVATISIFAARKIDTGSIIHKGMTAALVTTFALFCILCVERSNYVRWNKHVAQVAASYMDVQLWAKNNTPTSSLFMPDPAHSYGWRDFSQRSSFGNFREWGYSAIAYSPDKNMYQKGLARMREFGIDIEEVTDDSIRNSKSFSYSTLLRQDVRKRYYSMSGERLLDLAKRYSIDYFIMQKQYMAEPPQLQIAYQNDKFIILSSRSKQQ